MSKKSTKENPKLIGIKIFLGEISTWIPLTCFFVFNQIPMNPIANKMQIKIKKEAHWKSFKDKRNTE